MGTIETGKIISTIRKQKSMTQKDIAELLNVSDKAVSKWERGECYPEVGLLPELAFILEITIDELLTGNKADGKGHVGTENQLNRQFIIEDKNHNYIKGTIISFIVLAIALYWSLVAPYTIQAVSAALVLISFSIFYLYDKKYSDLLRYYKESKTEVDFPIIQASCRQFIISSGITVFIFVNLLSFNTIFVKNKYFIFENHLQYMLMGVTFYTFVNLFLFLKSNKNELKVPLYFQIGAMLSVIGSAIIICYQMYVKIGVVNSINSSKLLQNKNHKVFFLLMGISIIYSLLIFIMNNMSNKYKGILFTLSILQHSTLLSTARYSIWYSKNIESNVHAGIRIGYVGIALMISMTLYYIQTCIIRKISQRQI